MFSATSQTHRNCQESGLSAHNLHEKNPLKIGISREELRTKLPEVDSQVFQAALEEVVHEGKAEIEKDRVRQKSGTKEQDGSIERLEGRIVSILDKGGLTPPTGSELAGELGIKEGNLRDLFEKLVYEGRVVRVKGDMYVCGTHMDDLKRLVKEHLTQKKEMSPADFKEILGLSRKYMIPLLEYLDEIKLTIRTGDKRVLRTGP